MPPELPLPVPVTVAVMTAGPPYFSDPEVISRAWSRRKKLAPSWVKLTTYKVPLAGSMTGVPVIPNSGMISVPTSSEETVVAPAAAPCAVVSIEANQSGFALVPPLLSASKAYTLSCSVATNTTLCDCPPIVMFGR